MKKQNFVITGAGSFLGKALITYLLKKTDASLFITSRKEYDFRSFIDTGRVKYLSSIDLLNHQNLDTFAKEVDSYFPEVFHVVNCVGGYWEHFPLEGISLERSDEIINENILAIFHTAYVLVPIMKKRNRGHFIGFGCNSTRHHYPWMTPFTLAKEAVSSMMKSLCSEFSKYNLQFNTFLLATLKTEREHAFKPHGDYENWLDPKDVCEEILALVSKESILQNGSEIDLIKYSEQYNWDGYFKRISKE